MCDVVERAGLSKVIDTRRKVLDCNVTWLTKHKDTSWYEHKVQRHLAPLVVWNTDKAFLASEWQTMRVKTVVIEEDQDGDPWSLN